MGKFEIFEHRNNELVKIAEQQNRIVYDGREAWLDFMFGVENWFSGAVGYGPASPGSGHWTPTRVIAIGTVADSNDGYLNENDWLTGGSGITGEGIPTGASFAYFPNLNDSWMSSSQSGNAGTDDYNVGTALFYKDVDRVVRVGRQITLEATFGYTSSAPATNSETLLVGTEIREMGIFLGGIPTGSITPSVTRSQRPRTMLCRSVRYEVSGAYIKDNPIIIGENDLTIRYTIGEE